MDGHGSRGRDNRLATMDMATRRDAASARPKRPRDLDVLVVGDCPVLRDALVASLSRHPGCRASQIPSGKARTALEGVCAHVVLVVATPSGRSTQEILTAVRGRPPWPVLALSTVDDAHFVARVLANGARGCVDLTSTTEELLRALREVAADRPYLGGAIAADELERKMRAHRADDDAYASLTPREREVMQLVAEGLTNDDVAARLTVSRRTVEAHRAHVMDKLRLHGSIDLLRYALRRGLVALD